MISSTTLCVRCHDETSLSTIKLKLVVSKKVKFAPERASILMYDILCESNLCILRAHSCNQYYEYVGHGCSTTHIRIQKMLTTSRLKAFCTHKLEHKVQ